MAVDYKKLKVGDKVRYLGGDVADDGELTIGQEYVIKRFNVLRSAVFDIDSDIKWSVAKYNAHCFELVDDDKSESTCKCACKHDSYIISLAKEIARLKRELSDLRDAMQSQAHEDSKRIERILDDIVMLDERTQGVNIGGQKLLSKEVYIYDTE